MAGHLLREARFNFEVTDCLCFPSLCSHCLKMKWKREFYGGISLSSQIVLSQNKTQLKDSIYISPHWNLQGTGNNALRYSDYCGNGKWNVLFSFSALNKTKEVTSWKKNWKDMWQILPLPAFPEIRVNFQGCFLQLKVAPCLSVML